MVRRLLSSLDVTSQVRRCLLCRSRQITCATGDERFMTVSCANCGAVVRIEFNPSNAPGLRARIELLLAPRRQSDSSKPED